MRSVSERTNTNTFLIKYPTGKIDANFILRQNNYDSTS